MPNTPIPNKSEQDYQAQIADLQSEVSELKKLLEYYQSQLLLSKRRQFGVSSEVTNTDERQMSMFGEAQPTVAIEPETEEISYTRKKRKGKREEDLSGLPVERIDYELSEADRRCPQCGETMRDIGVDVRRELKVIPARFVVLEHAKHTYACKTCSENSHTTPMTKADAPPALINGSLASASLVAYIATQKYLSGMPLYRLEQGFTYDGVTISRQTMTNWVILCSERYLEGIYEKLKEELLKESVLHSDDTTVQVLKEPGRKASQKSYEWLYRTSGYSEHKIVIYDYQTTRAHEHPKNFLEGFNGYLHTDGYEAYHKLEGITVAGCWSHVRRYWEKALKVIPKDKQKDSAAETAVAYINELFRLEREYDKQNLTPQERYTERIKRSQPVSDAFFDWAYGLGALPKTLLGEAVTYTLNQRKYLNNIYLDGRLEISNNRAERSIKPFVMGRKAWLFSTSQAGARAS